MIRALQDYLDTHGFTRVDAPILTANAAEGTTNLFETDYFGQPAFLSQSGQLYNEAAIAALGRVYCFGPTFRAEKSKTRRHLIEFWMVEPEVAFMELPGLLRLEEEFVSYIVQTLPGGVPRRAKGAGARYQQAGRHRARRSPASPMTRRLRSSSSITRKRSGATTSAATKRRSWRASTISRSSSPIIRRRTKPSICSPRRAAPMWCWPPT